MSDFMLAIYILGLEEMIFFPVMLGLISDNVWLNLQELVTDQ